MKVKLSIGEIEIADKITWGIKEEIEATMFGEIKVDGESANKKANLSFGTAGILLAKYKAIELCVKKITLTNGEEITYSKEWMDGLDPDDGDLLYSAIDSLTKSKKK